MSLEKKRAYLIRIKTKIFFFLKNDNEKVKLKYNAWNFHSNFWLQIFND